MNKLRKFINYPLLALKGILVGFAAIVPGISGGALCVAFGMYEHILNLISHPFKTLKKHGFELLAFVIGAGIGFVGLSGLTAWLLGMNTNAVICVCAGFVLGTLPELWRDAGEKGRKPSSFIGMALGFVFLITVTVVLQSQGTAIALQPNFASFLLCGVLWGLSLIVPGLSSSTLIIYFGLYEAMTLGIASFDFMVLIPLGLGIGGCVVALAKLVTFAMKRFHSQISHTILGFVVASAISVIPFSMFKNGFLSILTAILCIIGGAAISFFAGLLCEKLVPPEERAELIDDDTNNDESK